MDTLILFLPIVLLIGLIAAEAAIGYRRGLMCNTLRLILLIISVLLAIPISSLFTGLLIKSGPVNNRINQLLTQLPDKTLAQSPVLHMTATQVVTSILRPVVYVAVFCLLKLITWGIYLLIVKLYNKSKLSLKYPVLTKKIPIGGLLLGGVYSLFFAAILVMPVRSFSDILVNAEQQTQQKEVDETDLSSRNSFVYMSVSSPSTEDQGIVAHLIGSDHYKLIARAARNPVYYPLRFTGAQFVSDSIFSSVAVSHYQNTTIKADDYILQAAKAGEEILVLADNLKQTSESRDYTQMLASASLLIKLFTENNLLIASEEEKLELYQSVINNSDLLPDNELVKRIISQMDYSSMDSMEKELNDLVTLADILNSLGLPDYLFDTPDEASIKNILDKLDEATVQQMADKLYQMDMAPTVVPIVIGILIEAVSDEKAIDISYPDAITDFAATKADFIEIFNSGKRIQYYMENEQALDNTKAKKIFYEDIKRLKNSKLITPQTYESLIQILKDRMQ